MEKDMNMQDKELDALFRSNLENMEVEPSANMWAGIAAGLDKPEAMKKPLLQYLSIAATIIVLLTAGIIFMPKGKPRQESNNVVKVKIEPVKKSVETVAAVSKSETGSVAKAELQTEQIAVAKQASPKAQTTGTVAKQPVEVKEEVGPVMKQQPDIAAIVPKTDNPNPVVPDNDVPLSEKNIQTETEPFKTKPVVMAQANLPQEETQQGEETKKKKSRGFGGFLNTLVSKIDKRKEKLVEFDDNQKLTGINLGIIKITAEEE